MKQQIIKIQSMRKQLSQFTSSFGGGMQLFVEGKFIRQVAGIKLYAKIQTPRILRV